jgi:hypothetical protein
VGLLSFAARTLAGYGSGRAEGAGRTGPNVASSAREAAGVTNGCICDPNVTPASVRIAAVTFGPRDGLRRREPPADGILHLSNQTQEKQ